MSLIKSVCKISFSLLLGTLLYLPEINAQNYKWADGYGTHVNEGNGLVKCDSQGNSYVVGFTHGGSSIGGTYLYDTSILLIKYNQTGDPVWVKTIGNRYTPGINDIFIDEDDQIYLIGSSAESFKYGSDTISMNKINSNFLLAVNNNGELLWQKNYNSNLKKVIVANQHIYLVGTFGKYATFNGFHLTRKNSDYNGGLYAAKLNLNGNLVFAKAIEGREFDYINMDVSPTGQVCISGKFKGAEIIIDGNSHSCSFNNSNLFVCGFSKNGNFRWIHLSNAKDGYLSPVDMAIDKEGDIYVAGNILGDVGGFTTRRHDYGTFVFKYSPSGKILYQREFATTNSIGHSVVGFRGCALAIDDDNSLFIASCFGANFNIPDFKGDNIPVKKTGRGSDIFIAKFHPLGHAQWAKVAGGQSSEWLRDLSIDKDNNLIIVGKYTSLTLNFDGHVINNNSGNSNSDAFVASLHDPTGIAPCPTVPTNILSETAHLCREDTLSLIADNQFANYHLWKRNGTVLPCTDNILKISTEGQYRLIVNKGTLCPDSSSLLSIEDKGLPLRKISHGDSTIICPHDSVVLRVRSFENSTFNWYLNNTLIESQTDSFLVTKKEGKYILNMTNGFCSQSDSIDIGQLEYPEIFFNEDTLSYQGTPIAVNPVTNIDSKVFWHYNYDIKEFSRSKSIKSSLPGNYTVVAKNYCGIDVAGIFLYDDHNAINENIALRESLALFPNPCQGSFIIQIKGFNGSSCLIEILNMKGAVVKSLTEIGNHQDEYKLIHVRSSNLPAGTYFVKVTQDSKFFVEKLIVND